MIHAVLVFNNLGKTRISRFYTPLSHQDEQLVARLAYTHISRRDESSCNIAEITEGKLAQVFPEDTRMIYRHYATLYFVFFADRMESELGILDLIQVFVEVLDRKFNNVCELDLIFHPTQVQYVLDEIIVAGLVAETNMNTVLKLVSDMQAYESSTSKLKALVTAESKRLNSPGN
jgi:AP-3 complex subunit sigma